MSQNATNMNTYPPYNTTPAQSGNQYPTMAPDNRTYTPTTQNPGPVLNAESSLLDYVYQKQYPPNGKKRHQILHQVERESSQSTNTPILNKRVKLDDGRTGAASSSISPSTQLHQSSARVGNGVMETPLIDMLPKKKQREILGVLGGLHSGIRLVRQQADSLQQQLDNLQSALGIDLEDAGGRE